MTRQELEAMYATRTNRNDNDSFSNRITSPGKFEGCPLWVPYYWDIFLDGGADEDDGAWLTFNLDASDVEVWPELAMVRQVQLCEDDNGFVHAMTVGS